ncbi:MAG: beta strand repeat-containing protein, partial [Burkholderiaceae bacterium]
AVNAGVSSGSGHISVLSSAAQTFGAAGDIATGSRVEGTATLRGTVDIEAGSSITMDAGAEFTTAGGNLRIRATGATSDITLGDLAAASGSAAIVAGRSILDADTLTGTPLASDSDRDITAASVRLTAAGSVGVLGASANAIETEAVTLAAAAAAGGINIIDETALTIGSVPSVEVNRVTNTGSVTAEPATAEAALAGLSTAASSNGSIVARATALTVSNAVSANGSGNVLLQAEAGTLAVNAAVNSGSGHISVLSSGAQSYSAAGDITTGSRVEGAATVRGTVDIEAAASITMNAGTEFATDGGNLRISATGATSDITLGDVAAASGSVAIVAGRSILDADALTGSPLANDSDLDITASSLRLTAAGSVGVLGASANAIETEVVTLAAAAAAGGINVLDVSGLTIGAVPSVAVNRVVGSGDVTAVPTPAERTLEGLSTAASSNGSVVLRSTQLTVSKAVSAGGSGDIDIEAGGPGASMAILADVRSAGGRITARASDSVQVGSPETPGVQVAPGASSGTALEWVAGGRIVIDPSANLIGAGVQNPLVLPKVLFRTTTPGRDMVIRDQPATGSDTALQLVVQGGFDTAIRGFDTLMLGGPEKLGEIRFENVPTLEFGGRVEFNSPVDLTANTIVESKGVLLAAGPSSVSSDSSATLLLRPVNQSDAIRIGGETPARSGEYVVDDATLVAIGAYSGRVIVGFDTTNGPGGRGPVTVSGKVDLKSPLTVYGQSLVMEAGSRLSAVDLQLRLTGDAWISELRSDQSIALQSSGGSIRSVNSSVLNIGSLTDGQVPMFVLSGRGAAIGSGDAVLRAAASAVNVRVPNGVADPVRLADGRTQYFGQDTEGGRYLMLEVTAQTFRHNPAIQDSAGDGWQYVQSGRVSSIQRTDFSSASLLASLRSAVALPPSSSGAPVGFVPVLKQLNEGTRRYLETIATSPPSGLYSSGIGSRDRDDVLPLDDLFDPLAADQQDNPARLENAWLLGSHSYVPMATGIDAGGSRTSNLWTDDDELAI